MSNESRTSRYKTAMAAGQGPMTVRQICERACIPATEAKFVSSGLDREVKVGRAEKTGPVTCPVTSRQAVAYRLLPQAPKPVPAPKAAKAVAAPKAVAPVDDDVMPDPVKKSRTVAKRRAS